MQLTKEQIQLLKTAEINLHYAHEAMRELNKDIFCDDGQEYPVPFIPAKKFQKIINGVTYPGFLKKRFHTLRQMQDFLSRSKELKKEYWGARIGEIKKRKSKYGDLFKKQSDYVGVKK